MKLLASVLLVAGATTSAHADDVLVWLDAKLQTDASGGATVSLATTKRDLGNAMVMHVVSTQGDLVEVEPVKGLGCTDYVMAPVDEIAGFRLFVNKADLAPVVTAAWKDTWKDGGYIALEAGMPIDPDKHEVALDERERLPVDVPAKLVGTRYAGHVVKWTQPENTSDVSLFDGDAQLGKHAIKVAWSAAKVTSAGKGKTAFPFAGRCVKGAIVVDTSAVSKGGVGISYGHALPLGKAMSQIGVDRHFIPKGTKLVAKGGKRVLGTLAIERDVPAPADPKADVCFDVTLQVADGPKEAKPATLAVCAPGSVVKFESHSRY